MKQDVGFAGIVLIAFVVIYAARAATLYQSGAEILPINSVSCHLHGPMEGKVPDPTNCNYFYICRGGNDTYTFPESMTCQSGDNGLLYYDFRSGRCDYNTSLCFDPEKHNNADFFTCARPYDPSGNGSQPEPCNG